MTDTRRRSGGRDARRAARSARAAEELAFLTRQISPAEIVSADALETIETNADTVLEQIGIEIVGYPEALEIFSEAGADVTGSRVRFPRGMCREIIQSSAPPAFTQHARNPGRSVVIGDPHTVLVPAYGSPFVRDLKDGRRYATIEDFRNFAKLTYMSPQLHHAGGTLCEPVDLPVNKRHYDMVYSHIKYNDKPFMGSVTHPERAQDSIEMARMVFGDEFMAQNCTIIGLCNANSPLAYDFNMLGSAKAYAEANQGVLVTPFILAGATSPVTVAAAATLTLAEALAGMAFCQIVRPGAPVIFGSFASSMSMQTGAPTFGTPEPQMILLVIAALARRLGVPFRSGGNFTASKVVDYQAAYESAISFFPAILAGVNFLLHSAGWLEGGLTMGYEKFILDADQAGAAERFAMGVDMTANGQAIDAILASGPGEHFLGSEHTLAHFETAFWRSDVSDNSSFEQWESEGAKDAVQSAHERWRQMLAEYEPPPLDEEIDARLTAWIAERKAAAPDSDI